jgi:hypothetical protein
MNGVRSIGPISLQRRAVVREKGPTKLQLIVLQIPRNDHPLNLA